MYVSFQDSLGKCLKMRNFSRFFCTVEVFCKFSGPPTANFQARLLAAFPLKLQEYVFSAWRLTHEEFYLDRNLVSSECSPYFISNFVCKRILELLSIGCHFLINSINEALHDMFIRHHVSSGLQDATFVQTFHPGTQTSSHNRCHLMHDSKLESTCNHDIEMQPPSFQ